jgi:hypothetical protein
MRVGAGGIGQGDMRFGANVEVVSRVAASESTDQCDKRPLPRIEEGARQPRQRFRAGPVKQLRCCRPVQRARKSTKRLHSIARIVSDLGERLPRDGGTRLEDHRPLDR